MAKVSGYPQATELGDSDQAYLVQGSNSRRMPLSLLKSFMGGGDRKVISVMLLDADVAIPSFATLGNVEFPVPAELDGFKVVDMQMIITPLGTPPIEAPATFQLVEGIGPNMLLVTPASIAIGEYQSGAVTLDEELNTLATGNMLSIECLDEVASGAKGPLWAIIKVEKGV